MDEKVTIECSGEFLWISPVKLSDWKNITCYSEFGEAIPTFSIDVNLMMPAEIDEVLGSVCIPVKNNHVFTLQLLHKLLGELFPLFKGRWEFVRIGKY
ncbi:hypothetical protein M942_22730 [Enterobacter ludwigii]|nr:hypothetical protein M942_22730 [Enterobacter ludwigii]KLP40827.1 hypothetical protein ABR36_08985 [Enterobacter ludwigii]